MEERESYQVKGQAGQALTLREIVSGWPEVHKYTGTRRSEIFLKLDREGKYYDPSFPRPVKIGKRKMGFFRDELAAWQAGRERL